MHNENDNEKNTSPILDVRDLHVYFASRSGGGKGDRAVTRAVDGISFSIEAGTTLGLVGESGCGKTTLGRALMRLIDVHSGSIHFDGRDVLRVGKSEMRKIRRNMQMVFQDPYGSLNPHMKVEKIIAEPLEIHGIGDRRSRPITVGQILEQVGLQPADANRYPHEFSGGQRQRIVIARAIVLKPKLLICDEPVSALDVSIQSQILNLLNDLKRELGLTYLFIAHNLAVVQHISDRVAVMYRGKIVEMNETNEIFSNPQHDYTKALLAAVPKLDPSSRVML